MQRETALSMDTALEGLRTWLLKQALPLWLAHGVDKEHRAFHEFLRPDGYACDEEFRRLRVAARQIYVFAQAHRAGLSGADEAVALGVDFLARHAALPGGGYARRFDLHNRPTDHTLDLYDHAFVLLALSTAAGVLPAPPLRAQALALEHFVGTAFPHPAGGYQESLPQAAPRRQNPHMHLLEALLAAHAAFGDPEFLARARTLVDLALTRMIDPATGALPEFFDEELRPLRTAEGFSVEPGHHCEWVWLLHRYTKMDGADPRVASASAGLSYFTDRHGLHPETGDVIDAVGSTGAQPCLTTRLWPQTERLKSDALRADTTEDIRHNAATHLAAWLLPDGLWHERRDAAGNPLAGPAPASSLYHLTCGILTVSQAG
jgi:mannose/cellobiose epimerase-like protein (N-acyl-D-glucosamine 2-epimerase family)